VKGLERKLNTAEEDNVIAEEELVLAEKGM